jgi:HD-GYP domain-containing protein (c-di-GMP phosphodiesterase class II)
MADVSQQQSLVLSETLLDTRGEVLLPSGTVLSEPLLDRLNRYGVVVRPGVDGVTAHLVREKGERTKTTRSDQESGLLESVIGLLLGHRSENGTVSSLGLDFEQANLVRVSHAIENAYSMLDGVSQQVITQLDKSAELRSLVLGSLREVTLDSDLALFVCSESPGDSCATLQQRISRNGVRTAILSLCLGCELGLTIEVLQALGGSAMLCDIGLYSLLSGTGWDPQIGGALNRDLLRAHPQVSAELLRGSNAFSEEVIENVLLHHELADGSGYPQSLKGESLPISAQIIGLAQTYLELTEPFDGSTGIVPADAAAYLVYHSLQGRFDRKLVQALVRCVSVYPIGSKVELSDDREALVIRSTRSDLTKPIVRTDSGPVDLRYAKCTIVRPVVSSQRNQQRLTAQRFHECLWSGGR